MRRKWLGSALLAVLGGVGALIAACGTDAVGVETCRQIEEARCRSAPNCPDINLSVPVHRGSPGTDIDACIRYYHDACLHGLVASDPGGPATKACVDAINAGDCKVVEHPETVTACAWLTPPAPAPADAAAEAAEGSTEADAGPVDSGFDVFSLFDDAGP
jgi:hypothetical protein